MSNYKITPTGLGNILYLQVFFINLTKLPVLPDSFYVLFSAINKKKTDSSNTRTAAEIFFF